MDRKLEEVFSVEDIAGRDDGCRCRGERCAGGVECVCTTPSTRGRLTGNGSDGSDASASDAQSEMELLFGSNRFGTVHHVDTVQLTKAFPSLKSWGRKRVVSCTVLYRI